MTQQYSETARWSKWCFENMVTLLQKKFPHSNIWIIKPSKMLRNIYSSFHNFLQCSIVGTPEYTEHFGAIPHLHQLLVSGTKQVGIIEAQVLPITLVGFSKGCVVLNQIVHELDPIFNDSSNHGVNEHEFLKLIKAIYWLDSGHNGESGAWMTCEKDIKALVSLGAELYIHVSPQQVCDPIRMWIGEEYKLFLDYLRKLGALVHDTVHFKDQVRCLENHFRILNNF